MPRFSVPAAPKCAKCAQSVYHVEQVIGPMSKTYHKHCLTCVVCAKRLDSTLLVEHDGEPFCKNCHKEHLGTGKGGFSTAVKLNPVSPKATGNVSSNLGTATDSPGLASPTPSAAGRPFAARTEDFRSGSSTGARSPSPTKATAYSHGLESEGVTGISVRSRGDGSSLPPAPASPSKASSRPYLSRANPGTPVRSIDDAVSSRHAELRDPVSKLVDSVGGLGLDSPATKVGGIPEEPHDRTEDYDQPRELPSASYYATPPHRGASSNAAASSAVHEVGTPSRSSLVSPSARSTTSTLASPSTDYEAPVTITTRRISAADTIGSVRLAGNAHVTSNHSPKVNSVSPLDSIGSLPAPRRPDPRTLTGAAGIAKVAPPRMLINPNTTNSSGQEDGLGRENSDSSLSGRAAKGGIERLGLGSIISDAGGGTPLCARCQKPVYFAEQKAAAGRKWHRGCLRCDGCSTTLDTGKLEEGPVDRAYKGGANIWCRVCYAKYFGPKNLAVGFSLPESLP